MNTFGFNFMDAQTGLFEAIKYGLFFGFFMGLLRYLLFRTVESKNA